MDINRTTLDSIETVALDSVCGLTNGYIFMYSNPISVCDRFSFTVTPTEGEIRGTTSEPDTGFFTRGEGVYMVHFSATTLVIVTFRRAGSGEQHHIRESGQNKSVWFNAIVSSPIVGEIYTCILTVSRYPVVQGSLGIV